MALTRTQKDEIVTGLKGRFTAATGIFVTEYSGLKVSQLTELRREIKKVEGEFRVLKNRLVKRALADTELKVFSDVFKGPIGVVFSGGDPVALTKVLAKAAENFEKLKLKSGFLGGKILTLKDIQQLSKLPSKEELYAKLLGTLQAPIQSVLRALQAVPQKVVIAVNGIREKKQAETK